MASPPIIPASKSLPRKKVLHIIAQLERGGAELRLLDLFRALDLARYEIHILLTSGQTGSLDEDFRELGVVLHYCKIGPSFFPRYVRLLLEQRYDVVHSHVYYASGIMLRLARMAKVPERIAHFRSSGDGHPDTLQRATLRALSKRWIDRSATSILSVSEGAMELAWSPQWRTDPRCAVLYNGLFSPRALPERQAVRAELGVEEATPLIFHAGTLVDAKNHDRLLSLFAAYSSRAPGARLLLAGRDPGGLAPALLERARSLGVYERVSYLGERLDVARLLHAADALLFPSIREGLPGVVLEACAVGTPVLASDLPGIEEIARHFPSVVTMSLSEADGAWAERLERLIREAGTAEARAATHAAFGASPFTVERSAQAYEDILDGDGQ